MMESQKCGESTLKCLESDNKKDALELLQPKDYKEVLNALEAKVFEHLDVFENKVCVMKQTLQNMKHNMQAYDTRLQEQKTVYQNWYNNIINENRNCIYQEILAAKDKSTIEDPKNIEKLISKDNSNTEDQETPRVYNVEKLVSKDNGNTEDQETLEKVYNVEKLNSKDNSSQEYPKKNGKLAPKHNSNIEISKNVEKAPKHNSNTEVRKNVAKVNNLERKNYTVNKNNIENLTKSKPNKQIIAKAKILHPQKK